MIRSSALSLGVSLSLMALLPGCAPTAEPEPEDGLLLLSAREQLIRLSVEVRGVHPDEAELAAIEAQPSLYADYVDRYLQDPRVEDRVEEIFNLRFLTRTGDTYFDPAEAGIGGVTEAQVAASLADEPLRLVRHIFRQDLPWSEIVTADYTMADPIVARMWDLDWPEGASGWQAAHYRDGRPMAGVLSMNTIWQRYPSMGGNANRHRANAVSKMLLCEDYLSRPIVLNRASIDQLTLDPEEAIQSVGCQSCHASLDPLAAHFFGFFRYDGDEGGLRAATLYRPENEQGWRDYSGKSPAWYGRPTANLVELGQVIAADPRFTDCAVRTVWEGMYQQAPDDPQWGGFQAARAAFAAEGMVLRPLLRHILMSREFRAGGARDADQAAALSTVRTASPRQLAAIIEDLTGYRWTFGGVDGLTDPRSGLTVLAGGTDGSYVTAPGYNPSVGSVFVQERLAQAAGWYVAAHDLDPARTEAAILLDLVTEDDRPDTDAARFDAQIRALYLRITGLPLADDATEPAELTALWSQIHSVEASPGAAWAGILSVVLRDPRVLFY